MNLKKVLVLVGAVIGLGLGLWFNPSHSAFSVLFAVVGGALVGNVVHSLVER